MTEQNALHPIKRNHKVSGGLLSWEFLTWKPTWLLREVTRRFPVNIMWINTQIKRDVLLCQLGHAKQQESLTLSPPLLKHSKYMTKHDTVGHIQFPLLRFLFIMFHAAFRQGKEIDGLNLTAPFSPYGETSDKSSQMHAALTGMFPIINLSAKLSSNLIKHTWTC